RLRRALPGDRRRHRAARHRPRGGDPPGARAGASPRAARRPRASTHDPGSASRTVRGLSPPSPGRRHRGDARVAAAAGCGHRRDRECCRAGPRCRCNVLSVTARAHTTAREQERAVLVGAELPRTLIPATESLAELARLAETAGLTVASRTVQ